MQHDQADEEDYLLNTLENINKRVLGGTIRQHQAVLCSRVSGDAPGDLKLLKRSLENSVCDLGN